MKLTALLDGQLPSHILLDLDGTLVDSAPDLALAVNRMLVSLGREPVGDHEVRAWVGNGTGMLVRRALAGSLDDSAADRLPESLRVQALDQFMSIYSECNGESSRVFEGVRPFIEAMAEAGVKMAVVTNKLGSFTDQLLRRSNLSDWFEVRVCGDTLPVLKPDPAPLHHALEQLGGSVSRAIMIGDSATDINSARAAGIPCIAVSYGYNHGLPIRSQGADLVVDSLAELL